MQHRGLSRRRSLMVPVAALASLAPFVFAAPAHADLPVQGLITRRIDAAPAGADALRFSVYGDRSGGQVQARLLALGGSADVGMYYAAPPIPLDFTGWKTVIVPLSDFQFQSEQSFEVAAPPLASVDSVQFAVTATAAKVFLDDLAWATTGSTPADTPLQLIDGFEGGLIDWRISGDYEQRRAITAAPSRIAGTVKSGAQSAQIVVRAQSVAERQLYGPTLNVRLKNAPVPYAIYARAPFETIVPSSTPAPAEILAAPKLSLFACAEEIEPTAFAVYAGRDLTDATVTVAADFLSESKKTTLPRAAIDIHVVKVWPQAGLASVAEPGARVLTPELLVKDDREPLTGPAPAVRLTGDPKTTIPAGTSKQFWITVRVPRSQPPSVYTGRLLFSAPGVKPTPITVSVEVLPMRLRTPFLQYGIDFRTRLSAEQAAPGEPVATPEAFARQLANIRDHGFKFLSLYVTPDALPDALTAYKEMGLSPVGPVVIKTPVGSRRDVENIEKARTAVGLSPAFEFYYNLPVAPGSADGDEARKDAARIREANRRALTVAPIFTQASYDALGSAVDVPVYSVTSEYAQKLLVTGKRENNKRDWWSWNLAQENPRRNRLYTGYLLYRTGLNGSGLYGAFPGPYQFAPGGDPFDETAAAPGALRPQMTTYPAQDGVIDTLQWEAAREGIDDIRYITNLKTYLREVKDLKIRKDATDEAEKYLNAAMSKPLAALPPAEYQTIRRGIADHALKLLTILRGSASRYPD